MVSRARSKLRSLLSLQKAGERVSWVREVWHEHMQQALQHAAQLAMAQQLSRCLSNTTSMNRVGGLKATRTRCCLWAMQE